MNKSGNSEKNMQKKGTGKIGLIVIGIIAIAYIVGIIFFQSHYLPKTMINGISCSLRTVDKVEQSIEDEVDSYVLNIQGRDGLTDTILGSEIYLKPVFDNSLDEVLKNQNQFIWPVSFWMEKDYEVSTVASYDENAFNDKLKGMVFYQSKNQIAPVDAYISEVSNDGFAVVPDQKGSTLNIDTYQSVVSEAVLTLVDTLDLDASGCYIQASILEDDTKLHQECDALNKLVQTKVVYEFGDAIVEVTPEIIADWIDPSAKQPVLVDEKVREFVNDLARKYDTFGKRRTFKTHTGEEIDITEGSYGWWMNRAQETLELKEMIEKGESGTRTPVYYGTAAQYGECDWGTSYVEIDLTEQHLYVFIEGENVFESDFVSGNVSRGFGTPHGIYGITYKERNATLVGQGYNSPVSFWMPFNNNVGMHDATWRKTFGGDIYLTGGSHGCINLPKDSAERIYNLIEKNTPVIVYGGKSLPKKEDTQTTEGEDTTEAGAAIGTENATDGTVEGSTAGTDQPVQPAETGTTGAEAQESVTVTQ